MIKILDLDILAFVTEVDNWKSNNCPSQANRLYKVRQGTRSANAPCSSFKGKDSSDFSILCWFSCMISLFAEK